MERRSVRQFGVAAEAFVLVGVALVVISQLLSRSLFDGLLGEYLVEVTSVFTVFYVGSEWHCDLLVD